MSARAFMDWNCSKCRRGFGTSGEMPDAVTCPYCKHTMDVSRDRRAIDAARAEMEREIVSDWEMRTPDQADAFYEGQRAYELGAHILDGTRRSPYVARAERPARVSPLHRWFMWGWHSREFGKAVGEPPV